MKLKDAIEHFGSRPKVCEALGISRMNAVRWGYWVPMKHAQNLSFIAPGLNYDHELYSGKKTVEIDGKKYTPATHISSTRLLEKAIGKTQLFFFRDKTISAESLSESDLIKHFRSCPMYVEVK